MELCICSLSPDIFTFFVVHGYFWLSCSNWQGKCFPFKLRNKSCICYVILERVKDNCHDLPFIVA